MCSDTPVALATTAFFVAADFFDPPRLERPRLEETRFLATMHLLVRRVYFFVLVLVVRENLSPCPRTVPQLGRRSPPPSVPTHVPARSSWISRTTSAQAARVRRIVTIVVKVPDRSERLLMEQLDYNLLFRWFVGLAIAESVW
jgi:hypothetical protein